MNLFAFVIGWWIAWLPPTGAVGPDLAHADPDVRVPAAMSELATPLPSSPDDAQPAVSPASPAEDDDPTDGDALDVAIARPPFSADGSGPAVSPHSPGGRGRPCPRTFPIRC